MFLNFPKIIFVVRCLIFLLTLNSSTISGIFGDTQDYLFCKYSEFSWFSFTSYVGFLGCLPSSVLFFLIFGLFYILYLLECRCTHHQTWLIIPLTLSLTLPYLSVLGKEIFTYLFMLLAVLSKSTISVASISILLIIAPIEALFVVVFFISRTTSTSLVLAIGVMVFILAWVNEGYILEIVQLFQRGFSSDGKLTYINKFSTLFDVIFASVERFWIGTFKATSMDFQNFPYFLVNFSFIFCLFYVVMRGSKLSKERLVYVTVLSLMLPYTIYNYGSQLRYMAPLLYFLFMMKGYKSVKA